MLLCTFAFTGLNILEDTTFFCIFLNEGVENPCIIFTLVINRQSFV